MGIATQEELLRQHEKDLSKLKNRPAPRPLLGFPMTPSSVVGTGLAIAGPGMVALTASSGALDIQDLFTDDFEDYLMYLDLYSSTVSTNIAMVFLNASGPYSPATAYRYGVQNLPYATTVNYTSPVQGPNLPFFGASSGAGGGANDYTIFSPHRAGTEVKVAGRQVSSGGMAQTWGWCNSGVGQATGIRLAPSSGTITGMLRCYGINPN